MMILIAYATSEGQTRRIARHIADRLVEAGHGVELLRCADAGDIALTRFDGAILAGSVHASRYQKALTRFVESACSELNRMPTLFLSVSLGAAGHDADDWRGLDEIVADLEDATGWTPGRVEHVAGAYLPSQYDILRRLIMRRIINAKDPDADPEVDFEYTDWPALEAAVDDWTRSLSRSAA